MDWLTASLPVLLRIVVSTIAILLCAIVFIRLNGLRSLSKMSSFDFVVTVGAGTVVASTAITSLSIAEGAVGFAALLFGQRLVARARSSAGASALVDNDPVVLMIGERMLEEVLVRERVTAADVRGKLREANVIELSEVYVVVLESTGDISVMHGSDGTALDARLLEGVRGGEEALAALAERRGEAGSQA